MSQLALTAEEREQLIPSYITLRHELNEAEQINTGAALRWAGARYWAEHATYPADEIAVRFSHRLVAIHPFSQ